MTIGERIKEARKAAGITQEDLGKKLGVSGSYIAQYETNKRNPKVITLQRIAKALNTHVFDLIGIGKELDKYEVKYVVTEKDGSPPTPERLAEIEEVLSKGPRGIYDSFSDYEKEKFWKMIMEPLYAQLSDAFDRLNTEGQQTAVKRVEELAEIPRYLRQRPSLPPTTEGSAFPPDKDAPETPTKGD